MNDYEKPDKPTNHKVGRKAVTKDNLPVSKPEQWYQ